TYSEPMVRVVSRSLDDRTIIQITDEGIGITPHDLVLYNARLSTRPILDLNAVRAMGLTVVGHIASRLGITVELRQGPQTGTIAEVALPAALLAPDTGEPVEPAPPVAKQVPRLFQSADVPPPVAPIDSGVDNRLDDTVAMPVLQFDRHSPHSDETEPPESDEVPVTTDGSVTGFEAGWRAARRAAENTDNAVAEATDGLPRRVPGDQLVPGGDPVSRISAESRSDYRDPAAVSATYAAYARGRSVTPGSSLPSSDDRSRATQ
ncbi:MAG: ATP-binding protein, partial [Stackebrandtia sp.]